MLAFFTLAKLAIAFAGWCAFFACCHGGLLSVFDSVKPPKPPAVCALDGFQACKSPMDGQDARRYRYQ